MESDFDILKSKNWHSTDEKDWKISWINRDVLFSKRLIELVKKLKAKGITETMYTEKKANKEDKEWVQISFEMLPNNLKIPITTSDKLF